MARLKNPLFSLEARKQLGKALIYKMKNGWAFATRYNFPGYKNPFNVSATQRANRNLYGQAVEDWRELSQEEKDGWDELAQSRNLKISDWNLFYKTAYNDPSILLEASIFGVRIYGDFQYGKE